jgi:hypothetical protein
MSLVAYVLVLLVGLIALTEAGTSLDFADASDWSNSGGGTTNNYFSNNHNNFNGNSASLTGAAADTNVFSNNQNNFNGNSYGHGSGNSWEVRQLWEPGALSGWR